LTWDQAKHRIPIISIPSCCLLTQEQTVVLNEQFVHPAMVPPKLIPATRMEIACGE